LPEEIALRGKMRRGLVGSIIESLIIDKMPSSALRGGIKMIAAISDISSGLFITNIGIALIPTSPSVVGGVLSAAIITGGIVEIGMQVPNFVEGMVEFRRHDGIEGLQNDISDRIRRYWADVKRYCEGESK